MKKLYICRHAKSSWKFQGIADFDRPLNKHGEKDAPMIGKVLAKRKVKPQVIFSSPAKRAFTTAKIIAAEIGYPAEKIKIEKNFYDAQLGYLIDFVQSLSDDLNEIMIIGHNPGVTSLNNIFSKKYIDNIPTAGVVELKFDFEKWCELDIQSGDLVEYEFPKKYQIPEDEVSDG